MNATEVLALPILQIGYREETREGLVIRIPIMPEIQASYFGPDDAIRVMDSDGVWWAPVSTNHGWMRRRA